MIAVVVTMNDSTMQVQVPMGLREGKSFVVNAPAPSNPTPTAFTTLKIEQELQLELSIAYPACSTEKIT